MKSILLILGVLFSVSIFANSIFSFDGMPEKNYGADIYSAGMGDCGAADLFRVNANFSNPSIATSTNKVMFSTGGELGYFWYTNSNNNFRDDGLVLPYFSIAVPIQNHRFGFSFNSISSGNLQTEGTISFQDSINYTLTNTIKSNLFKTSILYAHKNNFANLGISIDYYLGHRTRSWQLDFEDDGFTDAKYEHEKIFKNVGFTAGISKRAKNFAYGLSYSSQVKLGGDEYFKFDHYPEVDTLYLDPQSFVTPAEISNSFTFKFSKHFKTSVDFNYELWDNTDLSSENTYRVGCGFAFEPSRSENKWYRRIPLRFGGYYRELPFKINDKIILEKAVTFGLTIPLKFSDKKIDIAVKYLTRGNIEKHDVEDNALTFSFGITGFDIFGKRVRKTAPREIPKASK